MPAPVPYFDLIRRMKTAFDYRLRLVMYARHLGITFFPGLTTMRGHDTNRDGQGLLRVVRAKFRMDREGRNSSGKRWHANLPLTAGLHVN